MVKRETAKKGLILLFWMGVWQLFTVGMDNPILLAGPIEVLVRLLTDLQKTEFWQTILISSGRIMTGFLCAFLGGGLLAAVSHRVKLVRELSEPLIYVMKSVPIVSFVVILLIGFGSGRLSVWVAFLIAFPNLYMQVLQGLESTDEKLLEAAKVYDMPFWNRIWYLYRPAAAPFLKSGCRVSIGMAWKSGVAAEVIGLPEFSIGENIYMSKIYLDTAGVLSWTVVCILLSYLFEKLFLAALKFFLRVRVPIQRVHEKRQSGVRLEIKQLSKRYGQKIILKEYSQVFQAGSCYAFTEPSGRGKTTLFRMLCGLEKPDDGQIKGHIEGTKEVERFCRMAFQENRFFPELTTEENLALVCPKPEGGWNALITELLPANCLHQRMGQFSGGMARRVEVLRCMLSAGEVLILDEPFSGLDAENREKTAAFILSKQLGRCILLAAHDPAEVELLGATPLSFTE